MPIILPKLPIAERIKLDGIHVVTEEEYLEHKGIQIIDEDVARRQDIRPMEILILNLMPDKQGTEEHFARVLGHTPLQVRLTLLRTETYQSKHESPEHLQAFYKTWGEISHRQFDGMIITGAPIEFLPWVDVQYWDELQSIFDWAKQNVFSRLYLCWGAQAALQHFYGIEKHVLPKKAFGLFSHTVRDWRHPLVEGLDDEFLVPVARNTTIHTEDVEAFPELQILSESKETGLHVIQHENGRDTFMFNHPEYTANTLNNEYQRDLGKDFCDIPVNYFPENDPSKKPVNRWRAHGRIFYGNWLRQMYQATPYNLADIPHLTNDVRTSDTVTA
jgi:homoserine O-succinyltransferase